MSKYKGFVSLCTKTLLLLLLLFAQIKPSGRFKSLLQPVVLKLTCCYQTYQQVSFKLNFNLQGLKQLAFTSSFHHDVIIINTQPSSCRLNLPLSLMFKPVGVNVGRVWASHFLRRGGATPHSSERGGAQLAADLRYKVLPHTYLTVQSERGERVKSADPQRHTHTHTHHTVSHSHTHTLTHTPRAQACQSH